MNKPQLFPSVIYRDFDAGAAFLKQLGFDEVLVVRNESDPTRVEHSQFRWRDNGGLMAGSVRPEKQHAAEDRVGRGNCYLVLASDAEVDEVYARAMAAGGVSTQEPTEMDYGGRSAGVRDPEGNEWNLGSYAGE
ncbi:bleomycin resistance protein [Naumannella sp. ID2617S]|nr:bleomycin resistance protein [Naumannella sp. ID2617S]